MIYPKGAILNGSVDAISVLLNEQYGVRVAAISRTKAKARASRTNPISTQPPVRRLLESDHVHNPARATSHSPAQCALVYLAWGYLVSQLVPAGHQTRDGPPEGNDETTRTPRAFHSPKAQVFYAFFSHCFHNVISDVFFFST